MEKTNFKSLIDRTDDPKVQTIAVFVSMISILVIAKIMNSSGLTDFEPYFPWTIAASFLLFFTVFNAVFCLMSKDLNKYWMKSMTCYSVLAIVFAFLAYLFSSIPFGESGPFKWIFIVLTIVYLVFLSIVGFMKRIVEFAESEVWTSPKKRNKK